MAKAIIVASSCGVDMSHRFFEEISNVIWNIKGVQQTLVMNIKLGNKIVAGVPKKSHRCFPSERRETSCGFRGGSQKNLMIRSLAVAGNCRGLEIHFDERGKMEKRLINVPKFSGRKAPSAPSGAVAGSSVVSINARRVGEKDKRVAGPEEREMRSKLLPIKLERVEDSSGKGKLGETSSRRGQNRHEGSTFGTVGSVQDARRTMVITLSADKGTLEKVVGAAGRVVEPARDYSFSHSYREYSPFESDVVATHIYQCSTLWTAVATNQLDFLLRWQIRIMESARDATQKAKDHAIEKQRSAKKRANEAEEKFKASCKEVEDYKEKWELAKTHYREAVLTYTLASGICDDVTELVSDETLLPKGTMTRLRDNMNSVKEAALTLEVKDIQDNDFVVSQISNWMAHLASSKLVMPPESQYGSMSVSLTPNKVASQ
ncbi:unnamed protein product [Thlaspi arvense]|uniref:Uncharacterized protein n=1 Tax=Thlaspi arvense TaxID=13288 RepID=A0AAU9RVQ0_THLAR|nr:unnamed protein product [Thlaspi arvense]